MGKSKNNKIRIKFTGYNAEHVTGSQIYIECGESKKKILIECGLIQDNLSLLKEYQVNNANFDFKPKDLDYVFLCHCHCDHVGAVPKLYKQGCTARIIAPNGTKDLYREMCLDSSHIFKKDAEDLSKKFGKEFYPIYNIEDVYTSLNFFNEYNGGEKIILDENISFQYFNSGHIINSYQLVLWIKNGNVTRKIGITSDLGNIQLSQYYVNNFMPIESANVLIGETTYCSQERTINKKDREKDLEKLKSIIYESCKDNKGSVLIPTFALQRTQIMLTYIYNLFKDEEDFNIPVYIASPLASRICDIFLTELHNKEEKKLFEDALNWKNVKIIKDFETLSSTLKEGLPAIWLASSGMMNAGYSVYIAQNLISKSKNHIIFVGYACEGSLAYKIKNGKQKYITIEGKSYLNKCKVTNLLSMSSHMQREDLLKYYSGFYKNATYDKIALVHGDFKEKCEFAKDLQEEISKRNKTSKVICVNKSTEILV